VTKQTDLEVKSATLITKLANLNVKRATLNVKWANLGLTDLTYQLRNGKGAVIIIKSTAYLLSTR